MRTKQFYSERTVTLPQRAQAHVVSRKTTLYSRLQTEIPLDASSEEIKALGALGLLSPDGMSAIPALLCGQV